MSKAGASETVNEGVGQHQATEQHRSRATIRDVARLAEVSHQTVSRFLRGDKSVKAPAQERIEAAIAELDYRPNLVARAMRDYKTSRLALVVPGGTTASSLQVLAGASKQAHTRGYAIELITIDGAASARVAQLADSGLYEGVISLVEIDQSDIRNRRSVVEVIPQFDSSMRSVGDIADARSVQDLVAQLVGWGHRKFVHVVGNEAHTSARQRRRVYRKAMEQWAREVPGVESVGEWEAGWSGHKARELTAANLSASGATAVIAANDVLAAGVIRGVDDLGLVVPTDVSVTGWDNNRLGELTKPSLTTVFVDHERIGATVVARLLATLHGEPIEPDPSAITQIIWRESTAKLREN